MMRVCSQRQAARLSRDETGATAVEFALLLTPFLVMLIGAMDLGHQFYMRGVAQGALDDVSRRASVEEPNFIASGSTLEERVENTLKLQINNVAPKATYTITQKNFFDFNGIGNPERLVTDVNGNGQFDNADADCWEDLNENGTYDLDSGRVGVGGANDVTFYSVRVQHPRLFPTPELIGFSDTIDFTVETAVRNQPYANQSTPPVLCGDGT
ncbi:TadE/TadG family type IV pilus assembly protein [Qipengyuania sp. 902]|uniref:TadE/TadG family type IV pilus assembly protein n=1 Tax=Qipengyuania sp. 902 TaxID=3417565 RepID=UPI003EBCCC61